LIYDTNQEKEEADKTREGIGKEIKLGE